MLVDELCDDWERGPKEGEALERGAGTWAVEPTVVVGPAAAAWEEAAAERGERREAALSGRFCDRAATFCWCCCCWCAAGCRVFAALGSMWVSSAWLSIDMSEANLSLVTDRAVSGW